MSDGALAFVQQVSALGLPIPGENPAGEDLSFDADFEAVKLELDKIGNVSGAVPKWTAVITKSENLLTTRSKDFRLVTWLLVARMKEQNWQGLAIGLAGYHAVIKDFWDTMYPSVKRIKARANLFTWLVEHVNTQFALMDATVPDTDAVNTCDAMLRGIDGILSDKLGELYTGAGLLRNMVATKVRAVIELREAEIAAEAAAIAAAKAAEEAAALAEAQRLALGGGSSLDGALPPGFTAVKLPDTVENAREAMVGCRAILMEAAGFHRKNDPVHPTPYYLQRVGMWLTADELPEAIDGRTNIAFPEDLHSRLLDLRKRGQWTELLEEAENATTSFTYWLDLQRLAAIAMERLGPRFGAARDVIVHEVLGLVSRHPAICELSFENGTPFVSRDAQLWLTVSGRKTPESEDPTEPDPEAHTSPRHLIVAGKVREGLALAVVLANRAGTGRARFNGLLEAGELAMDAAKPSVARPILEGLLAIVERQELDVWEPALSVQLYSTLIRCLQASSDGILDAPQREARLFDKLYGLDPALAMKLARH